MAVLKIYKLDDQEETTPISIFLEGEHIIGREKLNCNDKRVSRNHALIIITENTVKIKATHVNPTYYKPYGGNSIQLIQNNNTITLNDKDKFALLPSEFWFRIRVENNQEIPESNKHPKRINEEEPFEEISKKPKINVSNDSEESFDFADSLVHNGNQNDVSISQENLNLNNSTEEKFIKSPQHKETSSDSETPDLEKENDESKNQNDKENTAEKNNETTSNNNPSTSTTKTKRDRCWYGSKCYRKNPLHRTNYSHPDDSDYKTDPEDDPPICPFGETCYRSNITHRKQFKHLKPPAPKPVTNINQNDDDSDDDVTNDVGNVRKRKAAVKIKKYTDTPEDDYDFDDPFLNDGSSDDFEISGDEESNDSDWMDSQEVDEESQDTRRLLKEAKKFTKKKK